MREADPGDDPAARRGAAKAPAPSADDDEGARKDGTEMLAPVSDPIGTARRRHGTAGAMLAAGLFAVDVALGRKPKEEAPVVVAAPEEPVDIDTDGITLTVDDGVSVVAPALPRRDPAAAASRGPSARPSTASLIR